MGGHPPRRRDLLAGGHHALGGALLDALCEHVPKLFGSVRDTKRALATFGNPFGLALYDRELAGVKNRKALIPGGDEYRGPWLVSLPNFLLTSQRINAA